MSPTVDRHVVTAVLVVHDGARWLPVTLKALLTQSRPVQRLVVANSGSTDTGAAVAAEVVGGLLELPRTTGYGAAVAAALAHPAASADVSDPDPGAGPRTEWVWLLHDDSAPAPDALARLLRAADGHQGATVLGPKVRAWDDHRVLLEMGVTLDGAGRRETGLDRREIDQGQHDGVHDVHAVGSAGMLVRRDVWDRLGGFDPDFGLFREDVDFCWRAHAAGQRVLVVGDAVVHHAEASRRGLREIGATEQPRRLDRRNALYTLLGNVPPRVLPCVLARNVMASLLRALRLFVVKQPDAARDELAALADVLRDPAKLRRVRAARADGRTRVYRTVRRFQPRAVALRRTADAVSYRLAAREAARRAAAERRAAEGGPPPLVRLLARPQILLAAALVAVTLAAERGLPAAGDALGGGALVPAWGGASDLWDQYLSSWHPVALGSDAGAPPYIGVLAVLATLAFGKPWIPVAILLLGSVPLAGLTAYRASALLMPRPRERAGRRAKGRRNIPFEAERMWFAATYALLPTATGAIAGGRLGTAVVLVLLPLLAVRVARAIGLPRHLATGDRRARARSAWGAALLLTVATAFVPLVWPLALITGLLGRALLDGRRGAPSGRTLAAVLATPPLLLLPWTLGLLAHPSRFLLEAGITSGSASPTPAGLVALDPGGPGTPAFWVTAGVLLAALVALPMRARRTAVLAGWLLAIFGLLVAILTAAASATAWPGVAVLFAATGVLLAAATAVGRAVDALAGTHPPYRAGGAVVVLAALTTPVLAAVLWIAHGAGGPLGRVDTGLVPEFLAGSRTLVLHTGADGRVDYTLVRDGARPRIGEGETPPPARARHVLDGAVAALAGARPGDDGAVLTRMGVQYVLVLDPGKDAHTPVLDAAPELARYSRNADFAVWKVPTPTGRVLLISGAAQTPLRVGADGAVRVPPGTGPRTLLLAEPADGGWTASLAGRDLPRRTVDGWAQGFAVPPTGGRVELERGETLRHLWAAVQGVAVVVLLILASPGAASDGFAPARRRAVRPEPVKEPAV
ncbi:glycosyltransferase family 2 protein [Actinomadura rayongensis]|uniref:Glycosyltransferase n=1 Tax=Actinomadura rayongensis TaxID=1429076 RepID=A0A6I4W8Q7_9ACTN|nr:glycosyltransferase family 2 protein [Actinomadura rayongensis]MXQ64645.1 glycosyltransferase [Actinomadura rayongensis]